MKKIIVKRGFNHNKVYYGAGAEVSKDIAELYPEHVKVVGQEELVIKEVKVEEPKKDVKKPVKGNKKRV